jgi:hypothetical protein
MNEARKIVVNIFNEYIHAYEYEYFNVAVAATPN